MGRFGRRGILAWSAASALAAPARAQPWSPSRSIRIVVAYSPGGGADTTARLLAGPLGTFLGQSIVVENRPGAGSTIGAGEVARAVPDGTTLLLDSAGHTMAPALIRNLSFDYATAFTPISQVILLPQVMVVPASSPDTSLASLLARAKAQPGRLTYASSGNGGAQHVTAVLLLRRAAVEMTHVPYRGGAPAMQALLSNDVDCAVATITSALPLVRDGKLRALAATGLNRISSLPEVPTVAEQGITGFDQNEWNGLLAPAGLPPAALERLHAGCLHALAEPAVRQRLEGLGAVVLGTTPGDFGAFLAKDRAAMAALVREAGIVAD
ncbi:MAG: tripartite tricarboxylate transporter substrate binding protein [Acetobacteraceae bacterium]|nr:MAG: tripartite tricarboxylate transporter substrate binding protein [Acetobacteraceae bacterium]